MNRPKDLGDNDFLNKYFGDVIHDFHLHELEEEYRSLRYNDDEDAL